MMLRIMFALALIGVSIAADCVIPKSPMLAQPSYFVYAPRYSDSYQACYYNASFTIIANTTDPTVGLGAFTINDFSQTGDGTFNLIFYDGDEDKYRFNFTPAAYTDQDANDLANWIPNAYWIRIRMDFSTPTTLGRLSLIFYPQMNRVTFGSTTPGPTTPTKQPFTNTAVPFDPANVNTDLAVVWVSTGDQNSGFEQMRSTISYIGQNLVVAPFLNSTTGSRLALQSFNRVPVTNNIGVPWELSNADFLGYVSTLQAATSDSATWLTGLKAFLDDGGFFDVDAPNGLGSRKTAQRVLAIFTQTDFNDNYADIKSTLAQLEKLDVHMVVVDYKGGLPNVKTLMDENVVNYAYFAYDNNKPYDFLSRFIVTGDQVPSFGCSPKDSVVVVDSEKAVTIPVTYNGFTDGLGGQKGRYCNQMNSWIRFNSTSDAICFTISGYELEVEKDWMKIYSVDEQDRNHELVVLNGIDVTQSKFTVKSKWARVQFVTNSDTVLGGVNFAVKPGSC